MVQIIYGSSMESLKNKNLRKKNKRLVIKLLGLVLGSILFAFALVPLYNLICTVTGLNGKTNSVADESTTKVDLPVTPVSP